MSYSDEWLKAVNAVRQPKTAEPVPVVSTTWKPWAQMTAEERRKALKNREEKKDATPHTAPR